MPSVGSIPDRALWRYFNANATLSVRLTPIERYDRGASYQSGLSIERSILIVMLSVESIPIERYDAILMPMPCSQSG